MKIVDHTPQFNIGELTDYETMKPKLMMKVIPQKGNNSMIKILFVCHGMVLTNG